MHSVLVVDDEAAVRQRVVGLLRGGGFTAIEAEDGLAGIELARRLAPRLILCDIDMPRLNGIALLCVLRDELARLDSRIVMMTAAEEPSAQRLVTRLGAHDWVSKPFGRSELLAVVRRNLGLSLPAEAEPALSLAG